MRNLNQFLADYGDSHENPVNQLIHFICVPVILVTTLGLFWLVPIGQWLGLEGAAAQWLNGATLLGALSAIVYLRLGLGVLALMVGWFAASVAIILGIQNAGLPLGWICLGLWVAAWIVQVYGHKVEGKKPSFVDDLVFLLIGPIFVSVEIAAKLGLPVERYTLKGS